MANKWKIFDSVKYKPHGPLQQKCHDSTARFRIPVCGRRWGKSTFAGHEATAWLFEPEKLWWIVGPTYTLGEKEFRVVYNDLKLLGLHNNKDVNIQYNVNTGNMRIRMPWDTSIQVVSAEKPDSLVGEGLDGVIMSEAAKHKRETWERHIGPALADKRGKGIFPSTPQGFNWFWELTEMGQDPDFPEYESFHAPSWTNLIAFPLGRNDPEIKRIEKTVSKGWFDQEIAALFTSREGLVYPEFDETIHVKHLDNVDLSLCRQYGGADFGFRNPFVLLDCALLPDDILYVWREYYKSGEVTAQHCINLKLRDSPNFYHPEVIYADPHDPENILVMSINFAPTVGYDIEQTRGYEAVKRRFKIRDNGKTGIIIDPSCINLRRELKALRMAEQKQENRNPKEQEHDFDNHACDALRYVIGNLDISGGTDNFAESMKLLQNQKSLANAANGGETFFSLDEGFVLGGKVPF